VLGGWARVLSVLAHGCIVEGSLKRLLMWRGTLSFTSFDLAIQFEAISGVDVSIPIVIAERADLAVQFKAVPSIEITRQILVADGAVLAIQLDVSQLEAVPGIDITRQILIVDGTDLTICTVCAL